jgi:Cu+-exporting ATPase
MIDPVCGMTVTQDEAEAAWQHSGDTYYFCSVACLDRFRKDPDYFVSLDPSERHM